MILSKLILAVLLICGFVLTTDFITNRSNHVTIDDVKRKTASSIGFCIIGIMPLIYILTYYITNQSQNNVFLTEKPIMYVLLAFGSLFGLAGDIFLDYKYCCKPNESHKFLYFGFIAFMLGHISYSGALLLNRYTKFYYLPIILAVCVVTAILIIVLEKPLKLKLGKDKLIATIYTSIATCPITICTLNLFEGIKLAQPNTSYIFTTITLLIAFIIFLVSDLVLSKIYYGNQNTSFNAKLNHILYYIAQYSIATTIAFSALSDSFKTIV